MKWNVVTDSSCDLLPSSYQSDVIELSSVPFVITVGDQHYVDDEDLDLQKMLHDMEQEKEASYTACPAPGTWLAGTSKRPATRLPLLFRLNFREA